MENWFHLVLLSLLWLEVCPFLKHRGTLVCPSPQSWRYCRQSESSVSGPYALRRSSVLKSHSRQGIRKFTVVEQRSGGEKIKPKALLSTQFSKAPSVHIVQCMARHRNSYGSSWEAQGPATLSSFPTSDTRVLSPQETALLTSGEGGGSELRSPPAQRLMILSEQHTGDMHTSLLLRFTLSHFRVPLCQNSWSGSSPPFLYRPQLSRLKVVAILQSDLMISIKLKGNQETGSGTSEDHSVP